MAGNRCCRPDNKISAPARSWMSAGCTLFFSRIPWVSTRRWRLRPFTFLAPSYPRGPPISEVLTDWLLSRGVFSQVLISTFLHLLIPAGLALLSVIGALAVT